MDTSIHIAASPSAGVSLEERMITSTAQKDWDLDLKHIFILSSSGKPIFSKNGDEQNQSTTFGLIQAVVSIIEISGDALSCIVAGDRTIVYFLRNSLYFVSISSTNEPAAVLSAQLEFMYSQIVFVLTSKVQEVLRANPSKDIRDLLGYDTTKQMHLSCSEDVTPPCVAFNAVNAFVCAEDLRRVVNTSLQNCMELSGAVLGMILYQDRLVTYSTNSSFDLELATSDFLLLANFVGKSTSLRSNDQNWVPICLPNFNPDAYMQAYVCNLRLQSASASKHMDVSLVLISTSADPEMFNALHEGRHGLERDLILNDIPDRLMIALESQQAYLSIYAVPISCLNFFFLFRPQLTDNRIRNKKKKTKSVSRDITASLPAPVQCHSFAVEEVTPSIPEPSSTKEDDLNR
jgi:vacuolar fusion protein MON1